MDVAVIFGQSNGIHRVNVVDESGRVQGIISQSDLGRYILSKVTLCGLVWLTVTQSWWWLN